LNWFSVGKGGALPHFAIRVDDLEQAAEALRAAG